MPRIPAEQGVRDLWWTGPLDLVQEAGRGARGKMGSGPGWEKGRHRQRKRGRKRGSTDAENGVGNGEENCQVDGRGSGQAARETGGKNGWYAYA